MDIGTLTHSVTTLLVPLLPYLVKPGEKALEEIGKKIGGETWDGAKALWTKLSPKIEAKPTTREAVQDAALAPDDEDTQAALRVQLKKLFTEDEALTDEVVHLLESMKAASMTVIASGDRSVGIGGNISGSTIITGDQNNVR